MIGFAALGVWFQLVGYSGAFAMPIGDSDLPWGRLVFLGSVSGGMLIAALFFTVVDQARRQLHLIMPFLLWVGTGMTAIAYHQSFINQAAVLVSGCGLMGLGYAWLALAWYLRLSRFGLARAVAIVLTGSGLLRLLVPVTVLIRMPEPWIVVATMLLPLLSAIALGLVRTDSVDIDTADTSARAAIGIQRWQLLALCVGLIVLRASGPGGLWGSGSLTGGAAVLEFLGVSLAVAMLYIALSALTIIRTSQQPPAVRHRLPMLVAIGGFLVLTAVDSQYPGSPLDVVIALANEYYYQLLFAVVLVSAATTARGRATQVVGWTLAFTYAFAIIWMLTLESVQALPRTVTHVVAYGLIIATALYPQRTHGDAPDEFGYKPDGAGNAVGDGGLTDGASLTDRSLDDRCAALAAEHRLTRREQDILRLLGRGRNLPFIQQELHLAEGTVRTHVSHVYQKLGVHSRQELISMLSDGGHG